MNKPRKKRFGQHPFRRAVLRGLGVVLPPLLTIVILAWILSTVQDYVLSPIEQVAKHLITLSIDRTLTERPVGAEWIDTSESSHKQFRHEGREFISVGNDQWIPLKVYALVNKKPGLDPPKTAQGYYHRFVEIKYLSRYVVLPVFFSVFILLLYLLGRFLAYGVGRFVYNAMEAMITQLPLIRTVYTSVKQVTDFVFSESDVEFTRVVAVQYPSKGIWSLGFVTGESMLTIAEAAGEPVISVLMPTSPMPATGFTITVRKSEAVDLDISVDQAFQFIVSCGVVVPLPQRRNVDGEVKSVIEQHVAALSGATLEDTPSTSDSTTS